MKRVNPFLRSISLLAVLVLCAAISACNKGGGSAGSSAPPQSEDEKTFYTLGLILGRNLAPFVMTPAELAFVKKGLEDQALGKTTDVKLEEYGPKVQALAMARQKVKTEADKSAGVAFAAKAAAEPGAEKLPSGVVFKSIKEGTGAMPAATDRVKVHYVGTLENGTEFDSSIKRGQPTEFGLNQVVKCWTEGVAKIKVGGKAKLTCPSDTAYGDRGSPPTIPGGATLTFEVELLDIVTAPAAAVPAVPVPAAQVLPSVKLAPKK